VQERDPDQPCPEERRQCATQMITGPCTAIWPAAASATFSGRLALSEPWVK